MEPPLKRLRLDPSPYGDEDEENQDELSMTPAQFDATQDPIYQLDKGRAKAATRLKSTFEDIFEKYGKDFDGDDDVINFYTDEIEVDNGHVQSLENRKDGATEDSLSGDEEERILNGKSGGQRKKARSKSLIPANYTGYDQRLQFCSPWDEPPGLGTHRLSSLSFSSPYGSPPAFDFLRSTFGSGHVDPVWQAPDLPIQPPRYQYGSLTGIGGGQLGSISALSSHVTKRFASAKSFLRIAPTSSKADNGDAEEEEEDDIILGNTRRDNSPVLHIEDHEKARVSATSRNRSYPSSPNSSEQPPFLGIGLTEDELHSSSDDMRKERMKNTATGPLTADLVFTPHQSAKEDEGAQHQETATKSHNLRTLRCKKGRPKKLDTLKFSNVFNKESNPEFHSLRPNERRIEIIIPIMKRLLPTEKGQPAEESMPVADKCLQSSDMEQRIVVNEDIEITCPQDSPHTLHSNNSHGDAVHQLLTDSDSAKDLRVTGTNHTALTTEGPNHATGPSNIQQQQTEQTQEHTNFSSTDTLPHDETCFKTTCNEAGADPGSSLSGLNDFTNDAPLDNLHRAEQESDCDNEDNGMTLGQRLSPIPNVNVNGEQTAHDTNMKESVDKIQTVQHNLKEVSVQSASQQEVLGEGDADSPTEMSDISTADAVVLETAEFQEPQSPRLVNEHFPQNRPQLPHLGFPREELLPILCHTSDNTTAPYDVQLKGVLSISEVVNSHENRNSASEGDVGSRNPEHSAVSELTESDQYPGRDYLPPSFEVSEISDAQKRDTPEQTVHTNVLVAEIDGLQLDSDDQNPQKSPSIGLVELPDQDLSVFPAISDADSLSESSLPLSSRLTESDIQITTGIGRSPSPELGTPIGYTRTSQNASGTNVSPVPTTPTRKQGSRGTKRRNNHHRTPSSKRFPLTSLIPEGIDDESDDELSIAGSFSSTSSRLYSPFFRATPDDNNDLPPLLSTPRKKPRKHGLLTESPPSSARTPDRILGLGHNRNIPPATESRIGRRQARQRRDRPVHSSPLARRVAERLLSSPTKRHNVTPTRSSSMVPSPNGTLRRCGQDGFECGRDFCFTCCV
ncbi:hypothetical protein F5Y12DRAFT_258710 [Xylaria sp. FL1777]|nr:hypothetical protein F5Y12DRAFT_258710 [Xylaria sp. FL1777]